MNEKQKEMAEALGLSQEKAGEIVENLNLPSTESEEDKVSNAPTWDRYTGFKFPADLVELFNLNLVVRPYLRCAVQDYFAALAGDHVQVPQCLYKEDGASFRIFACEHYPVDTS